MAAFSPGSDSGHEPNGVEIELQPSSAELLESAPPQPIVGSQKIQSDSPPPAWPWSWASGLDMEKILLSLGVMIFFVLCGMIEETLFSVVPGFSFAWFLTLTEMLMFAAFACLERTAVFLLSEFSEAEKGRAAGVRWGRLPGLLTEHRAPLSSHLLVGAAMCLSRGLTNLSMQYLVYSTQVVFKSMKLITVMLGSCIWLGKRFSPRKVLAAFFLVCSVMVFSMADLSTASDSNTAQGNEAIAASILQTQGEGGEGVMEGLSSVGEGGEGVSSATAVAVASPVRTTWLGIVVVLVSLVLDSAHSNSQEVLLKRYSAGITETMLYTNLFSAGVCLLINLMEGQLLAAIAFTAQRPVLWLLFLLRAVSIYCGVKCFIRLIQRFGVVFATVVSTLRKVATIFISITLFPTSLWTPSRVLGLLLFVASVMFNHEAK